MTKQYPGPELISHVAHRLGPLKDEVVFLGGAATALLITDPAAPEVRFTMDVDVVVEAATRSGYYLLAERLRELGFREDSSEGAPLCRWLIDHVIVDVMPTDESILGFSNRWYAEALRESGNKILEDGTEIRLVKAPYFLATKIEAFFGRGNNDFYGSHDMEDIIAVIDGRPEVVTEVRGSKEALRRFLAKNFDSFMANDNFKIALYGNLEQNSSNQGRVAIVEARIRELIGAV